MKKLIYTMVLCVGSLILASCGDFLEEYSNDKVYASSCEDLNEVLIGNGYLKNDVNNQVICFNSSGAHYWPYLHLMDDDAEEYLTGKTDLNAYQASEAAMRNFYIWAKEPWKKINGDDLYDWDWKRLYQCISYLNVINAYVDEFPNDPEEDQRRVRGEAQFLRAFCYYMLVNLYAAPYVKETADEDLGVPLKITEYIEDKYYSRDAIGVVYKQIVKDLKDACENLKGITQPTIYRANEKAAHTLLSRVYLYMGEWELALAECEKIIELGCPLTDLNGANISAEGGPYFYTKTTPEMFFTQGSTSWYPLFENQASAVAQRYRVSDELIGLYSKYEEAEDLRLNAFMASSKIDNGLYCVRKGAVGGYVEIFDACIIRGAEVYLNKAEAEAMLDKSEAINTLKTFMKHRYTRDKLPAIDHLQGEELVKFIREERRRELCFEGHRWFDLRRYAVSPKYPEKRSISHRIYSPSAMSREQGIYDGTYILKPYGEDNAWMLPIPDYEIEFDQGAMVDNPVREDRKKE